MISQSFLHHRVQQNLAQLGDKTAIRFRDNNIRYSELLNMADALRQCLSSVTQSEEAPLVLTCSRSPFQGNLFNLLLGLIGVTYEPLSLNETKERCQQKAGKWQSYVLLTDSLTLNEINAFQLSPRHTLVSDDFCHYHHSANTQVALSNRLPLAQYAYILSTSGSTGIPKAVAIKDSNLQSYLDAASDFFDVSQHDVFSLIHDVCFDFNIHELYLPMYCHSTLCIADKSELLNPGTVGRFVEKNGVTFWSCVPSFIHHLDTLRKYQFHRFNEIRKTMICGEALTVKIHQAWREMAPQSRIFNLYGPTECTVSVCGKDVTELTEEDVRHDVITIGTAMKNTNLYVLENDEVRLSGRGELLIGGPQVFEGYLSGNTLNNDTLLPAPHGAGMLYRTGDQVQMQPGESVHFLGRGDDQIQIRGHRIQKNEIINVIRQALNCANIAVVEKVSEKGTTIGIVLFLSGVNLTEPDIRRRLSSLLPSYALPLKINIGPLPMNKNMKVDHKKLYAEVNSSKTPIMEIS